MHVMYASVKILFKELKNGIGILVSQAVFKLWIKIVKIKCFDWSPVITD